MIRRSGVLLAGFIAASAALGGSSDPAAPPPLFVDVSDAAGLDFRHHNGADGRRRLPETMGAGGCVLDFDGDGWMDVYLVQSGDLLEPHRRAGNAFFRNGGDGTFKEVPNAAGADDRGYGQGAVCSDYDGDGDSDIYLTNFGPNVLLRNDGGRFLDVTAAAGVGDPAWSTGASWLDGDGDGDLDLYVVNYLRFTVASKVDCRHGASGQSVYCHPDAYPAAADTYYRNRGDGTFEPWHRQAGLAESTGKGLGVIALDFNQDGHRDLYVTNDSTPNFLYRGQGDGTFVEDGLALGVAVNDDGKTEAGMGVDAGDVNGNGFSDLVVTNLSLESNALYLGGATGFRYATRQAGLHGPSHAVLGFGTHLVDVDRDGHLDQIVVNGDVLDNIELINDALSWRQPGQVFLGRGHGRFRLLSPQETGDLARQRVGRGSMVLDYDNDGGLDLLVSYNGDRARLYRNRGRANHWLGIRLIALPPNPEAVGARILVTLRGRRQTVELRAGSSYLTSSDPRRLIGLGEHGGKPSVEVHWPDGSRESFGDLAIDRYHVLRQRALSDDDPLDDRP